MEVLSFSGRKKGKNILLASGATYTMRMVQHLSLWYYTTW